MEELPEVAALEKLGFESCAPSWEESARFCWSTGKHGMRSNCVQE
jgi:hypothetical protein